jgi:pantothenate kinase type III
VKPEDFGSKETKLNSVDSVAGSLLKIAMMMKQVAKEQKLAFQTDVDVVVIGAADAASCELLKRVAENSACWQLLQEEWKNEVTEESLRQMRMSWMVAMWR